MSHLPEDIREEIANNVDNIILKESRADTLRKDAYQTLYNIRSGANDEFAQKMITIINNSSDSNSGDRVVMERLKNEKVVK